MSAPSAASFPCDAPGGDFSDVRLEVLNQALSRRLANAFSTCRAAARRARHPMVARLHPAGRAARRTRGLL